MSAHTRRSMRSRSSGGFTLVESMVVLAITVFVMGVAAPGLASIIANQRVKTTGTDIYLSLIKARSEAIKRNASVTVAPKSGSWQNGWTVVDPASPTTILDDHGPVPGLAIVGPASVVYRASGRPQPGNIAPAVVSTSSGSSSFYQCVSVGLSGQPFMKAAPTC